MHKLNMKGIPKQYHGAVRALIAVEFGTQGKRITAQAAYKRLQTQWEADASRKAQQEQERKVEGEKQRAKWAKRNADEAIRKLAYLRDFMRPLGKDDCREDHIEAALLSRALLVEAASELEQALFTLGVIEGQRSTVRGRVEGWFKEFLK